MRVKDNDLTAALKKNRLFIKSAMRTRVEEYNLDNIYTPPWPGNNNSLRKYRQEVMPSPRVHPQKDFQRQCSKAITFPK